MPRKPQPKQLRTPGYLLHKPTGQAYVNLSGKIVYLGKYTLTPEGTPDCPRYFELIAEWLTNRGTTEQRSVVDAPSAPALTVKELIAAYWERCQSYYKLADGSESTELDAIRQSMRPLKRLFGETAAKDFGPKRLKAVRGEMVRMGWCRSNVNRQVSRVRQCFRWAVEEEMVSGEVDNSLRAVKGLRRNPDEVRESAPVRPVPIPAIDAVKPLVSREVRAMLELQLLTGMRPGEVTIMRAADIEMREGVWAYRPTRHKTQHHDIPREVPIGPKGQAILRPFLTTSPTAFLFDPRNAERERSEQRREARATPLTPSQRARDKQTDADAGKGKLYTVASYRRAIARACDRAFPLTPDLERKAHRVRQWERAHRKTQSTARRPALVVKWAEEVEAYRIANRWHPHQLRHNAATEFRKRYGLDAARALLGHSGTKITEDYAEQDFERARSIMGEVG
jgi:integrase